MTIAADRAGTGLEPFADSLVDTSGRWIPQATLTPSLDTVDRTSRTSSPTVQQRRGLRHHGLRFGKLTHRTVVLFGDSHAGHPPGPEETADVEGLTGHH
jgi:hypothetical protein